MTLSEAKQFADAQLSEEFIASEERALECEFGFYFPIDSKEHLQSGRDEDILIGSCGILVDRQTGQLHWLGSAFPLDYWFEAFRRKLHLPMTIVVTKVWDRQRASVALKNLQISFVVPEVAHGETWVVPQFYNQKYLLRALDKLPARFENQNLLYRLHDIEKIEAERDLEISLEEPHA